MKDIEVNEYVRTKDGIIDKVIIEYDGKCNNSNCSEKTMTDAERFQMFALTFNARNKNITK